MVHHTRRSGSRWHESERVKPIHESRAVSRGSLASRGWSRFQAQQRVHEALPRVGVSTVMGAEKQNKECVLHVCLSCRPPGSARGFDVERPGHTLYRLLKSRLKDDELEAVVDIRPADCLSVCGRACGIALSSDENSWVYLFGDQEGSQSVEEIVECLSLYLRTSDGYLPRSQRPKGMRGAILGRIPPKGVPNASF